VLYLKVWCGLAVVATRMSGYIGVVNKKQNGKLINIDNLEEPV